MFFLNNQMLFYLKQLLTVFTPPEDLETMAFDRTTI